MTNGAKALMALALAAAPLAAQDFPQAEISNGQIKAKLYLPNAEKGYYRSTRFDWSGVIPSLEYKGHQFFGQWFPRYDPKVNDSIQGPVEEFGSNALGFEAAQPGGVFVKIGVGALRKPDGGRPYSSFTTYDIVDNGKWSVRTGADFVEFTQELKDAGGYSYVYRKTVRLAKDKPVMTLEHSLRNTGQKAIDTNVYDHNFFMIDAKPTSPDFVVKFPFEVKAARPMAQGGVTLAETSGKELHFTQEFQNRQTAQSDLTGYGASASDFDFRVENRKLGVGVRETGDHPITRINFWAPRNVICPEAYNEFHVDPGKEATWKIQYEFYTFTPQQ
jgi:hypothetical protein